MIEMIVEITVMTTRSVSAEHCLYWYQDVQCRMEQQPLKVVFHTCFVRFFQFLQTVFDTVIVYLVTGIETGYVLMLVTSFNYYEIISVISALQFGTLQYISRKSDIVQTKGNNIQRVHVYHRFYMTSLR